MIAKNTATVLGWVAMKNRFRIALGLLLALFVAACPRNCSSVNKGEYIQRLDARCAEFKKKSEASFKEFSQFVTTDAAKAAQLFEKLVRESKEQDAELDSLYKPTEDAETLDEFFALNQRASDLLEKLKAQMKTLIALEQGKETAVPGEIARLNAELNEIAQKTVDVAKKYGFKECGIIDLGYRKKA
jgi:predicted nucleotidyltransferase